jgi:hypothetical protein
VDQCAPCTWNSLLTAGDQIGIGDERHEPLLGAADGNRVARRPVGLMMGVTPRRTEDRREFFPGCQAASNQGR